MALGRGLSELLSEVETAYDNNIENSGLTICELNIDNIKSNPHHPRKVFNEEKLNELSKSISQHGLLQPIVVTRDGEKFILIAGERRLKATKLAGFNTIKSIILDIENSKLRELALIENIQRDDLNIIELAYSYMGLINEHKVTHEELSQMVLKSRGSITNTLRLLTLSVFTQQMLGSSKITAGHAKVLIGLDEENQKIIVNSIIGQQLSVRETEQLIRNFKSKKESNIKQDIKKTNTKLNFKPLESIMDSLSEEKLSIKRGKNYLKIELNSNEDIEKLLKFFTKS
jgi:ParB family chromosome partitioning protein